MSSETDAEVGSTVVIFSICCITVLPRVTGAFPSPEKIVSDVHQWTSYVWIMAYLVLKLILQTSLYRIKKLAPQN